MSSTNKTPNYELNSWIGSDIPSREDFNRDNSIIDRELMRHAGNTYLHTTAAEKAVWEHPYYMGTYTGNGAANRDVTLECGFTPRWGILFAINKFPSLKDFNNKADYNYFALFSDTGSCAGVTLDGGVLKVVQAGTPVSGSEYRSFNETGVVYLYLAFR